MPAKNPEEICHLFKQYMAEGDLDSALSVYDQEAVFLNRAGEVKKGEALRQELAPFAAVKATFDFNIKQVIRSGDIALMHTEWKVSRPSQCPYMRSRSPAASQTARGAGSLATHLLLADVAPPEMDAGHT